MLKKLLQRGLTRREAGVLSATLLVAAVYVGFSLEKGSLGVAFLLAIVGLYWGAGAVTGRKMCKLISKSIKGHDIAQ